MSRRREELERGIEAAKRIRDSMRSPRKKLDDQIQRASSYLSHDPPYFDAAREALLQICGWMLNDPRPNVRRKLHQGPRNGAERDQHAVFTTKGDVYVSAAAETREGAICAFLESLTASPSKDKVSP